MTRIDLRLREVARLEADHARGGDPADGRGAELIHFQMTRAFNGGMDAYIVFRTPKTRSAVIIRFCCK